MTIGCTSSTDAVAITPEEQLRAGTYALLAALLRSIPDTALLQRLRTIDLTQAESDASPIGQAWLRLRHAAENVAPEALDDEFHQLFVGVGRGELVPFGSWYITGFLMERPLSKLRTTLARLGYQRQAGVREPEDHIAALCEVMALMIQDADVSFAEQQRFFDTYLAPWAETFCRDLEKARSARFFSAVGELGKEFFQLEKKYLEMPA